ncbi:MAG TPA: hypothetical protein VFE89_00940, partial [Beijerinckiaceae bacterium]|nr:hypothetical protein [Beijerinckiaceae bacterium]
MIPRNIGELLPIERAAETGGAGAHPRDPYAPGGRPGQGGTAACRGRGQAAARGNLEASCRGTGDRVGLARGARVAQQAGRSAGAGGERQ